MSEVIRAGRIEAFIYFLRGHKVMLDSDLAGLYGVETRIINRNVLRNRDRFPEDFMFQVTTQELESLRSQIGISKATRGGRRYSPYVFTEQGVAMLSSVLNSKRAIRVNVEIMRAFVRLRQVLANHHDLAKRLDALEKKVGGHETNFRAVFDAIRKLMELPESKERKRIGF